MWALEVRNNLVFIIDIILDLQYFTEAICYDAHLHFGICVCVCIDGEVLELLVHSVIGHLHQTQIFAETNLIQWDQNITFRDQSMSLLFSQLLQQ